MTKFVSARIRKFLFVTFALLFSSNMYASHLVGADLYYTHVSGNTYKITLAIYGNCGAASAAAFSTLPYAAPQICIYSGDSLITNLNLAIQAPDSGIEITPLCPGDTSQCTNPSSTIPGVKKFVYSMSYTTPYLSHAWRFVYNGYNDTASVSGRAASITNLSSPGATIMQLIDTLDNTTYYNSSPDLTVTQQTFFCLGQVNNYNPTAVDPDGDILTINLVDPANGIGTTACTVGGPVSYIAGNAWPGTPLSDTTPLQCAAGTFSMNTSTGAMSFFPNVIQRGVVVYNIEERRAGTTLVGTSQREMTVLVLTCGTGFPCVGGTPLSVPENTVHNKVEIYPNPAYDELSIKMDMGAYTSFTICNNIGQVMLQQKLTAAQTDVNVKSLAVGVYYITFKGVNGKITQKFVKM